MVVYKALCDRVIISVNSIEQHRKQLLTIRYALVLSQKLFWAQLYFCEILCFSVFQTTLQSNMSSFSSNKYLDQSCIVPLPLTKKYQMERRGTSRSNVQQRTKTTIFVSNNDILCLNICYALNLQNEMYFNKCYLVTKI